MPPCAAMLCARRGLSWMQKLLTWYPSSPSELAADAPASPVPTTITVNLRRLAGFTSFDSNRWRSHLSASAPLGVFGSNVIFDPRGFAPRTPPHAHSRGPLAPLRSRGSLRCARSRCSSREIDPYWNYREAAGDQDREDGAGHD